MHPFTVSISEDSPTFDLEAVEITRIDAPYVFVRTRHVYSFHKVLGNVVNRSRVVRPDKAESRSIEQVLAATIDAGFTGPLVWKLKLTPTAVAHLAANAAQFRTDLESLVCSSTQLQLAFSPAGNYYAGTNQTDLTPDVVFTV